MFHELYLLIFRLWRKRRQKLFFRLIYPCERESLLDVGGTPGFWRSCPAAAPQITLLNPNAVAGWKSAGSKPFSYRLVRGDGCRLPFADRSFTIGFSNSVLEHVGDAERQKAFAGEILRVAQKVWVQSPAFECPIEPHFLTPFFHWLPVRWRHKLACHFTLWGWMQRPSREEAHAMVDEIRLLTLKQFQQLFPDCRIVTEKLLGIFPKSYIAIRANPDGEKARANLRPPCVLDSPGTARGH